jgi:hypothetical protein
MGARREKEKRIVAFMIGYHCMKRHMQAQRGDDGLCQECRSLVVYAHSRLDACRYGDTKPACVKCPVHCYGTSRREAIRRVMAWTGPRMFCLMPKEYLRHLWKKG